MKRIILPIVCCCISLSIFAAGRGSADGQATGAKRGRAAAPAQAAADDALGEGLAAAPAAVRRRLSDTASLGLCAADAAGSQGSIPATQRSASVASRTRSRSPHHSPAGLGLALGYGFVQPAAAAVGRSASAGAMAGAGSSSSSGAAAASGVSLALPLYGAGAAAAAEGSSSSHAAVAASSSSSSAHAGAGMAAGGAGASHMSVYDYCVEKMLEDLDEEAGPWCRDTSLSVVYYESSWDYKGMFDSEVANMARTSEKVIKRLNEGRKLRHARSLDKVSGHSCTASQLPGHGLERDMVRRPFTSYAIRLFLLGDVGDALTDAVKAAVTTPNRTLFDFNTLSDDQKRAYLSIVIKLASAVVTARNNARAGAEGAAASSSSSR